jgi:hypothetical protein
MKTRPHAHAPARESTPNKLAHDGVPFTATCPKCHQQVTQHGYSRIVLFAFLDMLQPIDAYCPPCDELWPISSQDRNAISAGLLRAP